MNALCYSIAFPIFSRRIRENLNFEIHALEHRIGPRTPKPKVNSPCRVSLPIMVYGQVYRTGFTTSMVAWLRFSRMYVSKFLCINEAACAFVEFPSRQRAYLRFPNYTHTFYVQPAYQATSVSTAINATRLSTLNRYNIGYWCSLLYVPKS